ncbi:phosphatase PAP2 family protein [Halovivax limisalsi]|uniref:phosphatase PAP2 family protein n=1 Tax=Halovivax limisalsi TaxID=1453760 RepID=UPI001FFD7D3C|nr:phosphatase PAP2 family protein [Halovivax limisalsi]
MALAPVFVLTVLTVCLGVVATGFVCLDRNRLRQTLAAVRPRLRDVGPYLAVVAAFFLARRVAHPASVALSYRIDWNITDAIYAIEGDVVAVIQAASAPGLLEYFTIMYMFGFPFLLIAAPILYFGLARTRHLKSLLLAYVLNYAVGSLCYTLFIARGPRIHLDSVDGLMYEAYPQTQAMTAAISSNTNVFPSLHTSLAVVVLCFAWRTRRVYPRWFPIAAIVAGSVVYSTMYLGIHWVVDVVAGILLAVWSVGAADRLRARFDGASDPMADAPRTNGSTAADPDFGD